MNEEHKNGAIIARRPQNNNVTAAGIDFTRILNADKKADAERDRVAAENRAKLRQQAKAEQTALAGLFKKAIEKKDNERKLRMEEEQRKAEAAAVEEVREKYRAEKLNEWNERPTDRAMKNLLANLKAGGL